MAERTFQQAFSEWQFGNFPWLKQEDQKFTPDNLTKLGVDVSAIDAGVEQEIQTQQANTINKTDYFQDLVDFKQNNKVDTKTAKAEILKFYKTKWLTIEWINIDEELATQTTFQQTQPKETWVVAWLENFLWWAIANIPSIVWNIAWFWSDVVGDVAQKLGDLPKLFGFEWANITDEQKTALWDFFRDKWVQDEKGLRDFLGTDDTATMTQAGSFISDMAALVFSPSKKTSVQTILTKYPKLSAWAKNNPLKFKGLENVVTWSKFWAKAGAVSKWEVTPWDIALWAWFSVGLPPALFVLKKWVQWTWGIVDSLIKLVWFRTAWIEGSLIKAVESNPNLANKLLKWEITDKQLSIELKKLLPDKNFTWTELNKIKHMYDDVFNIIKNKWAQSEDDIIKLANTKLKELSSARSEWWSAVWAFRTKDIITNSKGITQTTSNTAKRLNLTKVDWKYTWADPEIIKAKEAVDDIYNSIIKNPNKVTQDELIRFHQAVKNKGSFEQESSVFNNAIKNFSDDISKFTDDAIWAEYVAAKETLKQTFSAIDDFSNLVNKGKGTIKENLRWTINSLKNPNNVEKLESTAKAFWTDKTKFLKYLDDVQKGWEAEEIVKNLTRREWISTFLDKLKFSPETYESLSKEWRQKLIKELEVLIKDNKFAELREKIFKEELWGKVLNFETLSFWDIAKIQIINPQLAEKLKMMRLFVWWEWSIWTSVNLSSNKLLNVLPRNREAFLTGLVKYEQLKLGLKSVNNTLKQKLSSGKSLTNAEQSLVEEYTSKLMIYWNIEKDIYKWITE